MATDTASRKAPPHDPSTIAHPKPKKVKAAATATANASLESSRAGTPSLPTESAPTSITKPSAKDKPPTSAVRYNDEGVEVQQCKHCKKFVLRDGFGTHSKQCLREKKEKKKQKELLAQRAQDEIDAAERLKENGGVAGGGDADAEGELDVPAEGDVIALQRKVMVDETRGSTPASRAAGGDNESLAGDKEKPGTKKAQNKKRKAEKEAGGEGTDKPPTKKKKTQAAAVANGGAAKPTAAAANTAGGGQGGKPRGPVDVEKQCGVLMPNGVMCARSLTCKSHSMGAKRSVPGRSAPYDQLLAAYQKKNQAKMQRAAIANMRGGDDFEESGGKVDSDEEREAVMSAVARAVPKPLVGIESMVGGVATGFGSAWAGQSVRSRYQHVRMKEMLSNALGGNRGGNMFAVAPRDAQGDAEGDAIGVASASRRQSMQPPPMRSGSVSGLA